MRMTRLGDLFVLGLMLSTAAEAAAATKLTLCHPRTVEVPPQPRLLVWSRGGAPEAMTSDPQGMRLPANVTPVSDHLVWLDVTASEGTRFRVHRGGTCGTTFLVTSDWRADRRPISVSDATVDDHVLSLSLDGHAQSWLRLEWAASATDLARGRLLGSDIRLSGYFATIPAAPVLYLRTTRLYPDRSEGAIWEGVVLTDVGASDAISVVAAVPVSPSHAATATTAARPPASPSLVIAACALAALALALAGASAARDRWSA